MKLTAEQIAEILEAGKAAAQAEVESGSHDTDGGTCNFDQAVLIAKGYRQTVLEQAGKIAGLRVSKMDSSSWWCGGFWLDMPSAGQGFWRTRCAEAAKKAMQAKLESLPNDGGIIVDMYYQMD